MPPAGSDQNNNFNQYQNGNQDGSIPPAANNTQDDGKTLSIIGLVMAFVGMQLIGLILSIIGLSKAKKAGASKGLAVAGIVLNIIGIIVGTIIAILFIVGIAKKADTIDTNSGGSSKISQNDGISSDNTVVSAVSADDTYDMDKACKNSYSISNSGTYVKGSAKVAAFYNTTDSQDYYTSLSSLKSSWRADSVSQVGLIVCMDASEGLSAGKSCDYESDGAKLSIPLYKTNYKVRIIEAYTGKVVATESITTNSGKCPSYVSYDKNDPKVFEAPSPDMIEGVLTPYAG